MENKPQWTTIRELAEKYDCFVLDCDGVVWQGEHLIHDSFKVVEWLEEQGKRVMFVSNNSTKVTHDFTEKMKRMGFQNPKGEQIFGSARITAQYMRMNYPEIRKVFVIGMKTLRAELEAVGIQVVGAEEHMFSQSEPIDVTSFENYTLDPQIGAVVMGHDNSFTMSKLCIASLYINQQNCKFVLTNTDRFTTINGRQYPGTGTLMQGILISLKDKTYEIAGKPTPFTMELIKKQFDIDKSRTIMIGDNPETDVAFGKASGVSTCLVLTGNIRSESELNEKYQSSQTTPMFLMSSFGFLK